MYALLRSVVIGGAIAITAVCANGQSSSDSFPLIDISNSARSFTPRALQIRSQPVSVVVLLGGDPVAVVQKKAGRLLDQSEKQAIAAARKAEQDAIQHYISAKGGQVEGTLQHALNGIRVKIASDAIDSLRSIPGVVDVKPIGVYEIDNTIGVQLIGAPQAWVNPSNIGKKVKVAIVDTGIDYTHANFGGPGTIAAWNTAVANSAGPADPMLFGILAPKVKGGIDLAGDAYNGSNTPVPDSNPLDCNGHGSHVAGTAAGFGVTALGATYTGKYSTAAYTQNAFIIGPGVAPGADLYAVRVFGCTGSTSLVSEAIDWAVANDIDVISMSLGRSFGGADNADSLAIHNATDAGIFVVAAAGNNGPIPYIMSAPSSTDGAISVAAMDANPNLGPGAYLALTGVPAPLAALNSNGATFANGSTYSVAVLRNPDGTVSLGCNDAEYVDALIAGKLVVTRRGQCPRVLRAQLGFKHGAAAVALINNAAGYPPYEGPISVLVGTGLVTIPFFGVKGTDGPTLSGPAGGPAPTNAIASNGLPIASPSFERVASFSSAGPRLGDSMLKPAVVAPGVSVVSTAMGTGNGSLVLSGTSMATPHVAGVAALVIKANPKWSLVDQRAALLETANPMMMADYLPVDEGSGLVQAQAAVATQAVVRTAGDSFSFGYADLLSDFHGNTTGTLHNFTKKSMTFNVFVTQVTGTGVTVSVPPSITVGPDGDASINVGLIVPATLVGGTHYPDGSCCAFQQVSGYVQFKPATANTNDGVVLTVPYLLVPRSRSGVSVTSFALFGPSNPTADFNIVNTGVQPGTPSFYTLGPVSASSTGVIGADTRAVGVRSILPSSDPFLVFAINTFNRFSNSADYSEWDILIDSTPTQTGPNYLLAAINGSLISSNPAFVNTTVAVLVNLQDNTVRALRSADAATDNSTLLLPVRASEIGVTAANPRFTYTEQHSNSLGASASTAGSGRFNAFTPALTVQYGFGTLISNSAANGTITVNTAEWANSPTQGLMIVVPDNTSGASQAQILKASH